MLEMDISGSQHTEYGVKSSQRQNEAMLQSFKLQGIAESINKLDRG